MNKVFVKKYWDEEKITFYIHFIDEDAVKQIEVSPNRVILTSLDHPVVGDSMLYDKSFSELELDIRDFISEEEFTKAWNEYSSL